MCKIVSLKSKDEKRRLLTLIIDNDGQRFKYTISEGTYRNIGCPLSGEEISTEELEDLTLEDEKRRAMEKALRLLAYADNNGRNLLMKLRKSGFSMDASDFALRECIGLGYIDEKK